jgi:hypothetical protein
MDDAAPIEKRTVGEHGPLGVQNGCRGMLIAAGLRTLMMVSRSFDPNKKLPGATVPYIKRRMGESHNHFVRGHGATAVPANSR